MAVPDKEWSYLFKHIYPFLFPGPSGFLAETLESQ